MVKRDFAIRTNSFHWNTYVHGLFEWATKKKINHKIQTMEFSCQCDSKVMIMMMMITLLIAFYFAQGPK